MNKYSGTNNCNCGNCPFIDYSRRANDGTFYCSRERDWVRSTWVCQNHPNKVKERIESENKKKKNW